jgi:hypothetical protein
MVTPELSRKSALPPELVRTHTPNCEAAVVLDALTVAEAVTEDPFTWALSELRVKVVAACADDSTPGSDAPKSAAVATTAEPMVRRLQRPRRGLPPSTPERDLVNVFMAFSLPGMYRRPETAEHVSFVERSYITVASRCGKSSGLLLTWTAFSLERN